MKSERESGTNAPGPVHPPGRAWAQLGPVHRDRSALGGQESGQRLEQVVGLPLAMAEHRQDLLVPDGEVKVADHDQLAVAGDRRRRHSSAAGAVMPVSPSGGQSSAAGPGPARRWASSRDHATWRRPRRGSVVAAPGVRRLPPWASRSEGRLVRFRWSPSAEQSTGPDRRPWQCVRRDPAVGQEGGVGDRGCGQCALPRGDADRRPVPERRSGGSSAGWRGPGADRGGAAGSSWRLPG